MLSRIVRSTYVGGERAYCPKVSAFEIFDFMNIEPAALLARILIIDDHCVVRLGVANRSAWIRLALESELPGA
jgi:hypothetical protein